MLRTLFFGTPDFAVPTLEAQIAAGYRPLRVITQPARPAGRGQREQEPAVARAAHRHGLEVMQVERVREPGFLAQLAALEPDVAVVVAFGQIFPKALLDLPRFGCINLHASLLPRHRGAAPIQAAIAAGDEITGVTTQQMAAGLDEGPILLQTELTIGAAETAGELFPRLAACGAELVVETLRRLEAGTLEPREQDPALVTYAPRLRREDGEVDWRLSARQIADRLRAFTPWPGLSAELRDRPLKLLAARPLETKKGESAKPGTLGGLIDDRLVVVCGGGTLLGLERVQRPGKKPLAARDFWNGERLHRGERFGGERFGGERFGGERFASPGSGGFSAP